MKRIVCIAASVLVLISAFASTAGAVSYTDLRPTYTENAEYADYVNTEIAEDVFIDDRLQFRSNCYGYAMRLSYGETENLPASNSYMQVAGEFYDKTPLQMTYDDLMDEYIDSLLDTGRMFDEELVYSYVVLDCRTLGYSASFVAMYDSDQSFIPPDASTYSNKRLVALVGMESGNDVHFYMQHEDNTWSHKPENNPATLRCINCGVSLTNSNISNHIHCRTKADNVAPTYDGRVILFWIAAPGSSDRTHGIGYDNAQYPYYTPVGTKDITGDYLCSALHVDNITSGPIRKYINYIGDEDYFIFDVPTSGSYSFNLEKDTYAYRIYVGEVTTAFMMTNTTVKALTTSTASVSFAKTLQAGKRYCIKVVAYNQTVFDPDIRYTIRVS